MERGIILVDFKLEFGKNMRGEIVFGDEISFDICCFWDVEIKESFDKDVFCFGKGDFIFVYERFYERIIGEVFVCR